VGVSAARARLTNPGGLIARQAIALQTVASGTVWRHWLSIRERKMDCKGLEG